MPNEELRLSGGADHRVCVVSHNPVRRREPETVAWVHTQIIDGNVVVEIARVDEAKSGPISVVVR